MTGNPKKTLTYNANETEIEALREIKRAFAPHPPYSDLETAAIDSEPLVEIDVPVPAGHIAFLENTAEQCTSPDTKHSQDGMQRAHHWLQRVGKPPAMFQRLTDGYGISLMCGERYHQFIRNKHNWRAAFGTMLDIDVFREPTDWIREQAIADDKLHLLEKRLETNATRPEPCYSQHELFERYPLLPKICRFLLPSASSLYRGRPFKARGIVLFPAPITDWRVFQAFGKILCQALPCIPNNVTTNALAVGFGNTHNAPQAYHNPDSDVNWIHNAIKTAKQHERESAKHQREQREQREQKKEQRKVSAIRNANGNRNGNTGDPLRVWMDAVDAVDEMVKRMGIVHRRNANGTQQKLCTRGEKVLLVMKC